MCNQIHSVKKNCFAKKKQKKPRFFFLIPLSVCEHKGFSLSFMVSFDNLTTNDFLKKNHHSFFLCMDLDFKMFSFCGELFNNQHLLQSTLVENLRV